ncbi:hypothetical protein [Variovorax sp. JS1663]|uniref:hypothetical protein n=1 Tax=Variovorax sp. JS1663 TaxID=1851577 RepID=UPI000B66BAB1|nr:hypothetical protein [Variovorax sp. JS1663]OUM03383.1 hypothetical protein A8M77_06960 [Variovorax sp. JS1663]
MLSLLEEVFTFRGADLSLIENLSRNKVTPAERKAIIDVIALELCDKGFDAQSEPTAYGLELERLIDFVNGPNLK